MKSEIKAINRLTDDKSKVSCHYFIKKNGQIICMVPENYTAWHAGVSSWKKIKRLNNYSIGIEIQNSGHISGTIIEHGWNLTLVVPIQSFVILSYR